MILILYLKHIFCVVSVLTSLLLCFVSWHWNPENRVHAGLSLLFQTLYNMFQVSFRLKLNFSIGPGRFAILFCNYCNTEPSYPLFWVTNKAVLASDWLRGSPCWPLIGQAGQHTDATKARLSLYSFSSPEVDHHHQTWDSDQREPVTMDTEQYWVQPSLIQTRTWSNRQDSETQDILNNLTSAVMSSWMKVSQQISVIFIINVKESEQKSMIRMNVEKWSQSQRESTC